MSRYYSLESLVTASGLSEAALARAVGLSGTGLKQARVRGLSDRSADRYAVLLGFHPAEVWADWWDVPVIPCGNDRCVEPVTGRMFCSPRCRWAVRQRRRRIRERAEAA